MSLLRVRPERERARRLASGRVAAAVTLGFLSITVIGCGSSSPAVMSHAQVSRPDPPATIQVLASSSPPPARAAAISAPATARHSQKSDLSPPPIIKDFIPFGSARKNEMREYAQRNYGIDSWRLIHPHLIIWHYTVTTTFQSVWNTFADNVPDVQYHELPQVCAHFVIDTNGTIYQLVPMDIMCRQVVGLNYTAIGIENVGDSDHQVMDDAAQFHAGLELTRWLRCHLGIPVKNVIGHNESLSSPYYRELVPALRGQTHQDFDRTDMNVVRADVAQLPCRA
jgi:beta-N-acetylhexosaminidase